MFKCLICNKSLSSKRGLANHIRTHNMTPTQYKEKFFKELHEGYVEGRDYLICPICGKERWGQLVRHLHRDHNLSDSQIEDLGINVRTQWYHEKQANAVSKAWRLGHRDHIGPKISKTKSENWTKEDTLRLYEARISKGAYSKIGIRRNQHLIDKFNSYEEYCNHLMTRLTNKGKLIEGVDSFREVKYRSFWEFKLSLILLELNIEFKYEPMWVKYFDPTSDRERRYNPDFLIESLNLVLEVKPYQETFNEKVIAKKEAVERLGYKFSFITEDDLTLERIKAIVI